MKQNRLKLFIVALVIAATAWAVSGCRPAATPTESRHSITVAGSTSVQPFAEIIAEEYMKERPELGINVQGGGSSAGVRAAKTGAAEIGMLSRELKKDEKDLTEFVIAHDAIAVVIHPENPVGEITKEQIKEIFAGRITNWKALGGPDHPIHVIAREEGSGTRGAFDELIMGKDEEVTPSALVQESNGSVRETVAGDPYAIGYVSLGLVDERVKPLKVDGVFPTVEAVKRNEYSIVRPFLFVTKGEPTGLARDFIDYVLGEKAQAMLREEGLVPVR